MDKELTDLRRRVLELERKVTRHDRILKRLVKFTDIARQATIVFLGAIEDLGNRERTIPSRRERRSKQ